MGTISVSFSGKQCIAWNETNWRNVSFPDGDATQAENFCRNPDPLTYVGGVWCYTGSSSDDGVEFCDVPMCRKYPERCPNV